MPAPSHRTTMLSLALAAVVLAVFWPVLQGELVYDDLQVVARNPSLRSLERLPEALTGAYWDFLDEESAARIGYWRPLTTIALFIAQQLGDGAPVGFHALSLGLHIAACIAAFLLLRRLLDGDLPAFCGALLFGVHPVHVEPVAWISAVSDPLMGLLVLVGLVAHLRWREAGSTGTPSATAVCFALALCAKESAAALLPMMLVLDLCRGRDNDEAPSASRAYGPVLLVGLAYVFTRMAVFADWRAGFDRISLDLEVPMSRLLSLRAEFFGGALQLLAWPADLAVFREVRPELPAFDPTLVTSAVWIAIWTAGLLWAARARGRSALCGLLLIPAAVFPILVRLGGVGRFPLSDRFLYLAVLGAVLLAVCLIFKLLPRAIAVGVVLVLAVPLAVRAHARIGVWESESTLFRHAVAETPRSLYTHWGLGRVLLGEFQRTGDQVTLTEALDQFTYAQNLASPSDAAGPDPTVLVTMHDLLQANLGVGWHYLLCADATPDRCTFDEAELVFRSIIERFPDSERASVGLGVSLLHLGRLDEAATELLASVDLNPRLPEAWSHLGRLEAQRGNWESAASYYKSALELEPGDVGTLAGLGEALLNSDLDGGAERALMAALALAPNDPRVMTSLGALAGGRGQMNTALGWLDRALAIDDELGDAHLLRAKALLALGQLNPAVEALQQACIWSPDNFEANYNLGVILLQNDLAEQAAGYLRHALELEPNNELAPQIRQALEDAGDR